MMNCNGSVPVAQVNVAAGVANRVLERGAAGTGSLAGLSPCSQASARINDSGMIHDANDDDNNDFFSDSDDEQPNLTLPGYINGPRALQAIYGNALLGFSGKQKDSSNRLAFVYQDYTIARMALESLGCDCDMIKPRGSRVVKEGYFAALARLHSDPKVGFDAALSTLKKDLERHGVAYDDTARFEPKGKNISVRESKIAKRPIWRQELKTVPQISRFESSLFSDKLMTVNEDFKFAAFSEAEQIELLNAGDRCGTVAGAASPQTLARRAKQLAKRLAKIEQMSETTPCTAVQTYECKSKSRVKNHTRLAKSETASVLVNKRAVAFNQIHDLDVLCKLVKMIEDEPAAQWTRVWSNTRTNALRLRFVRGLRQSYLHAEASFCNVSLNQAVVTIQYIHSFMDCREADVQNSFDSFDRDTIIKGVLSLEVLHKNATAWARRNSVPVPETDKLVFKGRPMQTNLTSCETCDFNLIVRRFNNSQRVIVEIINANAEPGSSGHYCEKNARSSESRPVPVEAEDVIRERLKAGADIRSIVNHFDRQQAHFKAKEPGVQIPDRYLVCATDVRNVRKKYGLDGRLAESDEDDVDLTVRQNNKKKRFYRVYKPRGEAWDNSSKRTHGLDLLKRPSGVYLESVDDPAQVFIAMANDVMVENLQRFGSYLLVNISRNIIPAQGLQLLTVFCIDSLGAGVEVLHVLTNHATVGVYERIFAVLGNLHKDRDYMPRSVMCDIVPGLVTAVRRMWQDVPVYYSTWHMLRAFRGKLDWLQRGSMDAESFRNFKQKIWLLLQDAITTRSRVVLDRSVEAAKVLLRDADAEVHAYFVQHYFSSEEKLLWSAAHRNGMHHATYLVPMTTLICEGWRDTIKKWYLQCRPNHRLATLLRSLKDLARERASRSSLKKKMKHTNPSPCSEQTQQAVRTARDVCHLQASLSDDAKSSTSINEAARVDPIEIDDASSSHGSDRATPSIEEAAPVNLLEIDDASSSHESDRTTSSIEEAAPVNLVEIDDAPIHPESDRAASSIGEAAPVDLVEIDDASNPDHDDYFSPVSEMATGRDARNSPEYEKRARDDAERFRGDVLMRMEADIEGLLAMSLNNVRPDKKPRLCELMITASQLRDQWKGITKQLRAIVQNDDEDPLDPEGINASENRPRDVQGHRGQQSKKRRRESTTGKAMNDLAAKSST